MTIRVKETQDLVFLDLQNSDIISRLISQSSLLGVAFLSGTLLHNMEVEVKLCGDQRGLMEGRGWAKYKGMEKNYAHIILYSSIKWPFIALYNSKTLKYPK